MRGMHRLLAAILLAGALGGLVVFARHLGRVPEPVAVRLSAPPPQHLTAPGAVHAPLLVTTRPTAASRAAAVVRPLRQAPAAPLTIPAAKMLTVLRVTTPTRDMGAPVAKPKPPATRTPAPAPSPPQEQVRVLAAVPLTPVATPTTVSPSTPISSTAAKPGNGKAHAYGHLKPPKAGKSSSVPAPPPAAIPATPTPVPVVQPAPVVELTPVDPGSADSADADQVLHGHGLGRGNGQGHRG